MATPADPTMGQGGDGGFILPPVPLSLRRPVILAVAFGILTLMLTGTLDRLLLGVLICAGLLLGMANAKLMKDSAHRITSIETPSKQKMAYSSAARVLVISVAAVVIGFLLRPDGIGIFFGLALFQVILVLHTTVPALKGLRRKS